MHAPFTLIRTLYRRLKLFERDKELEVRGDLPLDVELAEVPQVRVDVAEPHGHSDAVLPLLHVLRARSSVVRARAGGSTTTSRRTT